MGQCLGWVVLAVASSACNVPATIDLSVPFENQLEASRVMVPDVLRDDATMTIRRVPCGDDSMCPQFESREPAIRCVDGACDPEPFAFVIVSDPIDLNQFEAIRRFGDRIDRIEVLAARYAAMSEGLQNAVGPTELYWGPESATAIDSPGVQLLGTIPTIDLAAEPSSEGIVAVDAAGSAALSDHLVRVSRRFRFLARPRVDVNPGGPVPAGRVQLRVNLDVRVQGQLLR